MGLGLLLCAYFLFTFMSVGMGDYCFVTYILGALVATRAIGHLKAYNPRFAWLFGGVALYALLAVYYILKALDLLFLWDLPLYGTLAVSLVGWGQFAAELFFSAIALWSLYELARSVDLDKHRARALRNLIFVGMWAVFQIVLFVVPALAAAGNQALVKVLLLYQLVVYFFNTIHLYSCFSAICPQGEEFGKPSKPSRFKFINEMNRKLDEKNERARLEYEKNLAAGEQKFSAKNNDRHHKKKK